MKRYLFALFVVIGSLILAAHAQAQVIVIANPSVKASDVSKNDLKDVFTGASTSLGGGSVAPVLLKAGAAHEAFLQAYIGKNDTAYRAGWRSLVFPARPPCLRAWRRTRRWWSSWRIIMAPLDT